MANMILALNDVPIEEPLRRELLSFFERSSAYVVNQGDATAIEEGRGVGQEISRRWGAQTSVDELVAAIRSGDTKRAILLTESPALAILGRPVRCGVLAQMVRSGQGALVDYVRARLTEDATLAQELYAGRTLLHEAAAAGSLSVVELLLSLGADPNAHDGGSHTPLYSVGNECVAGGGGRVVRALVRGGADVDARDGVKRCTALHMAARRDNVEVAGALLDCGADIEAGDSVGETPLRRAVNCNQIGVATLLLARGANLHSTGSKGITPLAAARTTAMKRLLQSAV